jgi:DNA-directed RNA polymerase specialized sigma24 family protein
MPTHDCEPISRWIAHLKAGDLEAARPLWECYFDPLARLARTRLRPGGDFDGEDVALSAFRSFCMGAARGRFPGLADRDDLWRLLVYITAQKVCDYAERRDALKRGGAAAHEGGSSLPEVVGAGPSPEFAAMMAEEVQRLLDLLQDETLRDIAVWKMEGFTNEEITAKLGCARKTVSNKLRLIRLKWERESARCREG